MTRGALFAGVALLLFAWLPARGENLNHCRLLHSPPAAPPDKGLVLIIDDIGHHLHAGEAVVQLPGRVTLSVLPYTPHGARLARMAHRSGKEVMLHAPMSNLRKLPSGPGTLTPNQSEGDFRAILAAALGKVPHVRGVNNHMGSELTQRSRQMGWLMEELRRQELYFVDSRTSPDTVAADTALAYGIPHLSRHVFLDNERDTAAIHRQFVEALRRVEQRGLAVAIGHPYPETIAYLQRALPGLEQRGIHLVYASQVLANGGQAVATLSRGSNTGS